MRCVDCGALVVSKAYNKIRCSKCQKINRREQNRNWHRTHSYGKKQWANSEARATIKSRYAAWQQTPKGKYSTYKRNAKSRGLPMELSYKLFTRLLTRDCYYCGASNAGGIDRIDSTLGYFNNNCVPCCSVCNKMKMDLPLIKFVEKCNEITRMCKNERVVYSLHTETRS